MKSGAAKTFEDLVVWQKAHALVLAIYRMTAAYPKHELFGLTSQRRRAAVSIPANIAERFKRRGRADNARVLNIAESSLEELRYYLILSQALGYSNRADESANAEGIARILGAYSRTVLTGHSTPDC